MQNRLQYCTNVNQPLSSCHNILAVKARTSIEQARLSCLSLPHFVPTSSALLLWIICKLMCFYQSTFLRYLYADAFIHFAFCMMLSLASYILAS
jgi:hypothetical protein